MSARTESIPFLSIIRIPLVERRNLTQRPSLSTQNRWVCKFGRNLRRVLLCACETLFPATGRLPVTWHTLDIVKFLVFVYYVWAAYLNRKVYGRQYIEAIECRFAG